MARNGGGRGTHHQQPVGGGHQGRPIVLPGGQHSIPGHQGRPIVLPGGHTIDAHVKKILDLLDKTNSRSARADAHVLNQRLQDVGATHGWIDLISDVGLKQTHIPRLWAITGGNGYDIEQNLILSGTWSGRSWQSSEGLVDNFVNVFKGLLGIQDLPVVLLSTSILLWPSRLLGLREQFVNAVKLLLGLRPNSNEFPLAGTFKMTIGGSHPRYTAKFRDNPAQYNALSDIPHNMTACHLALNFGDVKDVKTGSSNKAKEKTSSSDDQIILCIRIVNAYVLVGQVRKEISKNKKGSKIPSNDEENLKKPLAEFVLVKDRK